MFPVIAAAVGLIGGALLLGRAHAAPREGSKPSADDSPSVVYLPDPANPFGPYHRRRRPPGLPLFVGEATGPHGTVRVDETTAARARGTVVRAYTQRHGMRPPSVSARPVRMASARGAALRPVADTAHRAGLGEAFVKTMTHLARTEGEGGTFAVPARNFNAPCQNRMLDAARRCTPVDAPRAGALITAWGVFQWNRDAGRLLAALDDLGLRAPPMPSDWMPWDWTASEEIGVPIDYYAQLWSLVRRRGGTDRDAARGVRLWHTGPSRFRRYLQRGADPRAWGAVDPPVAARIDSHLDHAGIA